MTDTEEKKLRPSEKIFQLANEKGKPKMVLVNEHLIEAILLYLNEANL